jgi:SAM-dependent methyltransferase
VQPSENRPPDVYATARGPLARVASPLAARARARRHERFFALTRLWPGARVLDVGCGALGLRALEPDLDITGVDLVERPAYPGPFVRADAAEGLPFAADEFDLAYCSSVIEHVAPARRAAFAAEVRRVGRGWYVQSPAFSFPLEPHSLLPGAHWLPSPLRRRYWRLGAAGGWEEISLLRRGGLEALFGPALPERVGPLVKSWVCVRAPASTQPAGRSAGQPADVVADAVDHQEQQQHDADGAVAIHGDQGDPPPAQLLGDRPQDVAAVERQEREEVDHGEH